MERSCQPRKAGVRVRRTYQDIIYGSFSPKYTPRRWSGGLKPARGCRNPQDVEKRAVLAMAPTNRAEHCESLCPPLNTRSPGADRIQSHFKQRFS